MKNQATFLRIFIFFLLSPKISIYSYKLKTIILTRFKTTTEFLEKTKINIYQLAKGKKPTKKTRENLMNHLQISNEEINTIFEI